jgi:large subunit ribosomal protein L35Ae
MEGRISAFRGSFRRKSGNQMIIHVDGVTEKAKAQALVGKTVVWTAPGKDHKKLKGKISAAHGGKGAVRAIFETGMPGQSLGEAVTIE